MKTFRRTPILGGSGVGTWGASPGRGGLGLVFCCAAWSGTTAVPGEIVGMTAFSGAGASTARAAAATSLFSSWASLPSAERAASAVVVFADLRSADSSPTIARRTDGRVLRMARATSAGSSLAVGLLATIKRP